MALYWSISSELAACFQIIPANKNQDLASDEISKSLLHFHTRKCINIFPEEEQKKLKT